MRYRQLFAAAALVAAGCSSDPSSPTARSVPAKPPVPIAADEVETPTLTTTVGKPLTVRGLDATERFTVTVLAYRRAVLGKDPDLDVPASGNRYDAVQVRIANRGSAAYGNAPSNETTIVTGDEHFAASPAGETVAGPDFSDDDIAPGATATGWVTFELLDDAKVTAVQFSSGLEDVAEWSVE